MLDKIIKEFGGVRALSREIGVNASSVSRWKTGKRKIPTVHWRSLMSAAVRKKIKLSLEDLLKINS